MYEIGLSSDDIDYIYNCLRRKDMFYVYYIWEMTVRCGCLVDHDDWELIMLVIGVGLEYKITSAQTITVCLRGIR